MNFIRPSYNFYLLNIFLIFYFHYLIGDTLFFLTDFYTMAVYVVTFSLLLLILELPIIFFIKNHKFNKFVLSFLIIIFLYFILLLILKVTLLFLFYLL